MENLLGKRAVFLGGAGRDAPEHFRVVAQVNGDAGGGFHGLTEAGENIGVKSVIHCQKARAVLNDAVNNSAAPNDLPLSAHGGKMNVALTEIKPAVVFGFNLVFVAIASDRAHNRSWFVVA